MGRVLENKYTKTRIKKRRISLFTVVDFGYPPSLPQSKYHADFDLILRVNTLFESFDPSFDLPPYSLDNVIVLTNCNVYRENTQKQVKNI